MSNTASRVEYTADQLRRLLGDVYGDDQKGLERAYRIVNIWLRRGDGVAVYENHDLGHPEVGHKQIVSYGGPEALLENTDDPPVRLPDIDNAINWRYQLIGLYRGELL